MMTLGEKEQKRLKKEKKKEKKELKKKRKRESSDGKAETEKKQKSKVEQNGGGVTDNREEVHRNGENDISVTVANSADSSAPLVVSFPNGVPTVTKNSPSFTWSSQKTKTVAGTITGKLIQGTDATCSYSSKFIPSLHKSVKSSKLRNHPSTKIMIGIFDKQTNSLTLHLSAENGMIFPLQQKIKPLHSNDSDADDNDEADEHLSLRNLTEAEKRRVLFDSFGSSKKKKELKGMDANKVNVSSLVGTDTNMLDAVNRQPMSKSNIDGMKEAALSAKQNSDESKAKNAIEKSYAEARKAFLPPFNIDAKLPHLIYDPKRICDEASWGQISRTVDACLYKALNSEKNGAEDQNQTESWVSAMISRGGRWSTVVLDIFKTIQDPTHNKTRIKCVLLLQHMISFYQFFSRDRHLTVKNITVEKLASHVRLPYDVAPHLLRLFTTEIQSTRSTSTKAPTNSDGDFSASYTMDKPLKNKCLVHILLLYLIAHGKEMKVGSINGIAKLLHLEMNVASNLLRQSGCTVTKKMGGTLAVSLNAPLKFPPAKRIRR